MHCQRRVVAGAECRCRHARAEIRAADAQVDHRTDRFACVAAPVAGTHIFAKQSHLVVHGAYAWHDVLAVHEHRDIVTLAQGDM